MLRITRLVSSTSRRKFIHGANACFDLNRGLQREDNIGTHDVESRRDWLSWLINHSHNGIEKGISLIRQGSDAFQMAWGLHLVWCCQPKPYNCTTRYCTIVAGAQPFKSLNYLKPSRSGFAVRWQNGFCREMSLQAGSALAPISWLLRLCQALKTLIYRSSRLATNESWLMRCMCKSSQWCDISYIWIVFEKIDTLLTGLLTEWHSSNNFPSFWVGGKVWKFKRTRNSQSKIGG